MKPNIFPALRYTDGHAAIDWLVRAFGFEKLAVHDGPDGSVAHAELRFGPGVFGLSSGRSTPADNNPWSRVRQGVYVSVDEVDALHDRAQAAGAAIASPLADQDYGSRDFSARDPEGHLWGFGTYDMAAASGEQNIFVGLRYLDSRAALAWLERAFGFRPTFEALAPDGQLMHAEMRLGNGAIMLDSGPKDPAVWGENDQAVYVYFADPDAHCARAKEAGARVIRPPHDTPWGARRYLVQDLDGFLWGFSTYKPAG
jgi:uncharacterized glyoxalase superfamily protein PhnB